MMPVNPIVAKALGGKKRRALAGNAGKKTRAQYKSLQKLPVKKTPGITAFETSTFGKTPAQALLETLERTKNPAQANLDAGMAMLERIGNTSRLSIGLNDLRRKLGFAARVMEGLRNNVPRGETLTDPRYVKSRHTWSGRKWQAGKRTLYVETFSIDPSMHGKKPDKVMIVTDAKPEGTPFVPPEYGEIMNENGARVESYWIQPFAKKRVPMYKVMGRILFADQTQGRRATNHLMYYLKDYKPK